jgi:hypothetical protein
VFLKFAAPQSNPKVAELISPFTKAGTDQSPAAHPDLNPPHTHTRQPRTDRANTASPWPLGNASVKAARQTKGIGHWTDGTASQAASQPALKKLEGEGWGGGFRLSLP